MVSTNGEICHTIKLLDLWKKSYGVTIQNNETSLGPLVNKNPYTLLFISKEFTTRNLIYTNFFLVHFFLWPVLGMKGLISLPSGTDIKRFNPKGIKH